MYESLITSHIVAFYRKALDEVGVHGIGVDRDGAFELLEQGSLGFR